MYSYEWDKQTGGYYLKTSASKFIASEIRPVFSEEITITGLEERLQFDKKELRPLLWAKQNVYLYKGEEVAKLHKARYGESINIEWRGIADWDTIGVERKKITLSPVNIDSFIEKNSTIMSALVADTLKRIKEMYDTYAHRCDVVYIGFSGGKDSVVLLDLCHKVLPLDVPVVFSDTDMELPDTYKVWDEVQKRYPERTFIKANAAKSAIENWYLFGPPSQALRWCCSVHKSTPAILKLKEISAKKSIKTMVYIGVRGEESTRRSTYDDIGEGLKSQSQVNAMPILSWSAHELWLYTFENHLLINAAYRNGIPRVGCLMCPMSTNRQNELIRLSYGESVHPFAEAVRTTISREFTSEEDMDSFVYDGGWFARKSGVSLKDVIFEFGVERKRDRVACEFPVSVATELNEWLKAIGKIDGAELTISQNDSTARLDCIWQSGSSNKTVVKWLTYAAHKAVACVGCRVCEAECPTGALEFSKKTCSPIINETKCIHCMRCYAPDDGCWRYYSKRYAGAKTMNISGINKYMTFGLKPEWITVLMNEASTFRQTTALGPRMIPSAVTWFREAGLIAESTAIKTTSLIEVGKQQGVDSVFFWDILLMHLINISPLIKWYFCKTEIDVEYSLKQLDELLAESVSSLSVRKGALQSLCQVLKSSPLGEVDNSLVTVIKKGRSVAGLTRNTHNVDPLVILYGLYVIAEKAGRSEFTVRQLMVADFESDFVSPLVAFAMTPDDFKKQCVGLSSLYPNFISCSFTLGLDEIQLFPVAKSCNDVVELILQK